MPPFRTHNDATNQPYYHQPRPASEGHWEGEGDGVLRSPFLHELIRVGSVMRGSVPFSGGLMNLGMPIRKRRNFFHLFLFGQHTWPGAEPTQSETELSWQGPVFTPRAPARTCRIDWADVVDGSMLWAYYHPMKMEEVLYQQEAVGSNTVEGLVWGGECKVGATSPCQVAVGRL